MANLEAQEAVPESVETNNAAGVRRPCVTASMLRDHFHLPLYTVAKKFSMCTTAFKKMCRRLDIPKWPHRQLRGIDKRIAALQAELAYTTTGDKKQFLSGISFLQEEKARLAQGLVGNEPSSDPSNSRSPSPEDVVPEARTLPVSTVLDECDSDSDDGSAADDEDREDMDVECDGVQNAAAITEKELRENFHLPLHTVAKKFGMCTTAFKKMCRRFGIAKWPHRQLRGIDKKIASLKAELTYSTGDMSGCRGHLKRLQEEKARLSRTPLTSDASLESSNTQEAVGGRSSAEVSPTVAPGDVGKREGAPPSSSRVGIRNLLCDDEEHDDDDDDEVGPEDGRDTPPMRDASRAPSGAGALEGQASGSPASGCLSATVTESLLREHFHLPLQVVAKKFGMCTTAFKKLCRRFGVAKWPHRQLRGIDKKIAALRAELAYSTGDRDVCRRSLQVLEDEKARLSRVTASPAATAAGRVASPRVAAGDRPHESPSPFPQSLSESPRRVSSAAAMLALKSDPEPPPPMADGACGGGGGSALDLLAAAAAGAAAPDKRIGAFLSMAGWSGAGTALTGGGGGGGGGGFVGGCSAGLSFFDCSRPFFVLQDAEPGGGSRRAP